MAQSRVKYDTYAQKGLGFPTIITMNVAGTYPGAVNNQDSFYFPDVFAAPQEGNNALAVASLTHMQVFAQTPGDRTTGSYTYEIKLIDSAGNVLEVLGTATLLPAHAGMAQISLANQNGTGKKIPANCGIRLDCTSAAPTGGATTAANIRVRIFGETYGIAA